MKKKELNAAIARAEIPRHSIAAELGISTQALYNKINGVAEFKASEIKKLASLLHLSIDAVNNIFFDLVVN